MGVPDFQSIMLPLLRFTRDGAEHRIRDAYNWIAKDFNLSEEEQKELLPSGNMPILTNRVQWAKTYLAKAGILK